MFRILITILSFFFVLLCNAQIPHGAWRDHFSFNDGRFVSKGNGKIYCASSMGLFTYDLSNAEIDKLTKVNGLSDVGISSLVYLDGANILAVGYESGNIDLVYPDRIQNIVDIKEKSLSGSKAINGFLFHQDKIYVSTDFGIVVVDPLKIEIKDTYFLGIGGSNLKVNNLVVFDNRFWAATERGLLFASVSDPLLVSYERWTKISSFSNPNAECVGVTSSSDVLFAVEKQEGVADILWLFNGATWREVDRPFLEIKNINAGENKLIVTSNLGVATYSLSGLKGPTISAYSFVYLFKPNSSIQIDEDRIAIADGELGLVIGTTTTQFYSRPQGPANNLSFSIAVNKERVVVVSGAYDATFSNFWNAFTVHGFKNEQWVDYQNWGFHDAVVAEFNPMDPSSYFVGSWGSGIFQFSNNEMVNRFTPENSSLQSIFPNAPFCRISGLAFDTKGNLWVSNAMVANPISVRKTDGTWVSFPYATAINADKISTLRFSPYGSLWLVLPRGEGLFALHPGSNIDSKDDDKYRKVKPYDRDGNVFNIDINTLAFDNDGYLWLGTSQGVLLSYNPERVFDSGFYFQKIKIPDVIAGLAVYLLETEVVTTISVDGGNRKWFGTAKSGVFLFNSDGTKELLHFTAENSPLPSNSILDIKVHPVSGEVFIATEKGLVSYRGNSTEPSQKFGKVYSYPNPVPPGYSGKISIVGLVNNTIVKITDISGNLVYETRSEGGMATWDGKSLKGNKVGTGVYLVFCSDETGSDSAVTKILFIK